jgi:hypothetical protein
MKTLFYKRTHNGDPENGVFGAHDCMGRVRALDFDNVVGIGGLGKQAWRDGIAGLVNWIGIGAVRTTVKGKRGPEVRFARHVRPKGISVTKIAPEKAARFYAGGARWLLVDNNDPEVQAILKLTKGARPSRARRITAPRPCKRTRGGCPKRKMPGCPKSGSISSSCY